MKILPTHVIYALNRKILQKYKFLKEVVFDPELSFSTAIANSRASRSLPNREIPIKNKNELPLLSWNRTSVRKFNNRTSKTTIVNVEGHPIAVNFAVVEFDYKFNIYTTDIEHMEQFELDWILRRGLHNINNIIIDANEYGRFEFLMKWDPELTDVLFSASNNYYKAISGFCTISGTFIYSEELTEKELKNQITEITININDCKGNSLVDKNLPLKIIEN